MTLRTTNSGLTLLTPHVLRNSSSLAADTNCEVVNGPPTPWLTSHLPCGKSPNHPHALVGHVVQDPAHKEVQGEGHSRGHDRNADSPPPPLQISKGDQPHGCIIWDLVLARELCLHSN